MRLSSPTPIVPSLDASGHPGGVPAPVQSGVRASLGTLTGVAHAINQDTITHHPGHFSGVADGVGGGAHGEVASRLLMQQLSNGLPNTEVSAQDCLANIDQHITQVLNQLGDGPGASVFAAAWPLNKQHHWQVLWVGDCQVTHYQRSSAGWQMAWQSQAQTYQAHQLTPPDGVAPDSPANMVGCGMSLAAGWHRMTANAADRIVIASDGFHKAFTATEKIELLAQASAPLLLETAQQWCHMARQRGSQDDISVLILEITPTPLTLWWVIGTALIFCILVATFGWFLY
jgi:serine/threonine protein phosphatase PrpC